VSYILDAVRKAEDERREQQAPFVYSLQSGASGTSVVEESSVQRRLLFAGLAFIALNVLIWQYSSIRPQLPSISYGNPVQAEESAKGNGAVAVEPLSDEGVVPQQHTGSTGKLKLWQASAAAQTATSRKSSVWLDGQLRTHQLRIARA